MFSVSSARADAPACADEEDRTRPLGRHARGRTTHAAAGRARALVKCLLSASPRLHLSRTARGQRSSFFARAPGTEYGPMGVSAREAELARD